LEYKYLNQIQYPSDLRKFPKEVLPEICHEVREFIIDTLSDVGGHFASNLGAIELTVALHYTFQTPEDKIVWDVGHQTYPHKILTGRKESLKTVRKFGGLSGFPKREESEYDLYNTGHAGTSISQVLGEACARDLLGKKHKCIGVIGDASIATGMALEAMNHAGHLKPNLLIILNDNYMSISKNVGSISNYLNLIISSNIYNSYKKYVYLFLKWLPLVGPALESFAKKIERSIKLVLTPGALFEDFGFSYIGPVDGHDVLQLVDYFQKMDNLEGPLLLHVLTQKGKGYTPAEKDPIKYHGVTPFNKESGAMASSDSSKIGFSKIVGKTLSYFTRQNPKVVAITPAMIEGSGLKDFSVEFPKNTFDTGIAEQHAVAFAGAMQSGGLIPFMCIYSTFLTRGLDQMVQDVSLMNLPVRFVIDRAGIVGADGETHQGLSDIGYLLSLPNMKIISPSNGQDLIDGLKFMLSHEDSPSAIRFPKDSVDEKSLNFETSESLPQRSRLIQGGGDLLIISVGSMLDVGNRILKSSNLNFKISLIDLLWIQPLDLETLTKEIEISKKFIILEESYITSGASQHILGSIPTKYLEKLHKVYALPVEPILHGDRDNVLKHYRMDDQSILKDIENLKL
jgi:1-deoxy-D-xylulose-5-phosphate synthase